jgi:hypothetical protein
MPDDPIPVPRPPKPPGGAAVQRPSSFNAIMANIYKYTELAASAVLQAQQEGVGQPGETKSQIALGIVHAGLQTAGLVVPGAAGAAEAERTLEPIFAPLFKSIVNIFRSYGHPAFANPPAPSPANPAPASGQ